MKISLNWLADYVELPKSVAELAERLTMAGLEVEGIERLGENLEGVVVAQVLAKEQHPNAEKLSLVRIDAGPMGQLQLVCGAKNFAVGDKVPLATMGTVLPGGAKIERATLRGVESCGMLCSAKELGLAEESSGLLLLSPELPLGQPIADALGLRDTVLELNVTPNRGDCLSHLGVAREVAALTGKSVRMPSILTPEESDGEQFEWELSLPEPERCPAYAARKLTGVTTGPSPQWMANRLRAVGVRSISNAVDITNYVLFECGQPLHAFDLEKLSGGKIEVRRAHPGEKMVTLDAKERALDADDLLICDGSGPVAMAGVMGGATSELSGSTREILLESARFLPASVRRSAKRHALHSEASYRFERGVDPAMLSFAQDRAVSLYVSLCGARAAKGRAHAGEREPMRRSFTLRFSRISELLGAKVSEGEARSLLCALGFEVAGAGGEGSGARVTIPTWRPDVEGMADCAEELARIKGFSTVEATLPGGSFAAPNRSKDADVEERLRTAMAASGFCEAVNYSFVAPAPLALLAPAHRPIELANPLSLEQSALCTTRLAGLLGNVRHNLNRQMNDLRLYELGSIYWRGAEAPAGAGQRPLPVAAHEERVLAGVMVGSRAPMQWGIPSLPIDFYDLKGVIEALLEALGIAAARFVPLESPLLHPRTACSLEVGGAEVGLLGELHPALAAKLELPRGLLLFELRLAPLLAAANLAPRADPVPVFPAVLRDIALLVDAKWPVEAILEQIREAGRGLVEEALLFDVYRGPNIPPEKRSLAFGLRLRSRAETLSEEAVNQVHTQIVQRLAERFGAQLRA